jgi:L-alanine-DL-glutamate epimerase-like enolase superfamily enzyme
MKISTIETIPLRIPFTTGGPAFGFGGQAWNTLDTTLVRVETEDGLVGWGDAFSYGCQTAVKAALDDMLIPLVIGQDATDIVIMNHELQQKLHLFGRYGISIFALSGLDIALWDLAAKRANLPLHQMLGGSACSLPAYASLFRYGDPDLVAERSQAALAEGYEFIKLHETEEAEVSAAREAVGEDIPIMVDTNCPWTPEQARIMAEELSPYGIYWLEEPIFPPEDFLALARLQQDCGIPLAAGENACTAMQFREMFAANAVSYAQPSVTKVGGITEFRKVQALADTNAVTVMPHSPYFGPGFLATLQLLAATANPGLVERFYVDLEASLYGDAINPVDGEYDVPTGPGLGVEPDPDVIKEYRVD